MRGRTEPRPRMRMHVFYALFGASALAVLVVLVASAFILHRTVLVAGERDILRECSVVAHLLNDSADQVATVSGLGLDSARVTLIGEEGEVLYDSAGEASAMENHASRPEIIEAHRDGTGFEMRESSTVLEVSLYGACLLENGNVVRLAVSRDGVMGVMVEMLPIALALVLIILVFCALMSRYIADKLVAPFASMGLGSHDRLGEGSVVYEEIAPLIERIDEQHAQIERQLDQLTDNDRMRVEFTANVTHELKTPLTVVSGYAELIKTGIAAPQDVPGFAGRIYDEAQHLTALVNDILTLSRMDEAERIAEKYGDMEPVDLGELCKAVVERLDDKAQYLEVDFRFEKEADAVVEGVPKLLDQIVYNLCDNALRYNKPGGSVWVYCGVNGEGRPYVTVEDTGIGIAEENLAKIFNRFFRVDTGRSRQTGGTGLGLAIVKHAARCHDAELGIESELGKGTVVSVVFKGAALAHNG